MFSSQPQEHDYDSENIVYEPVDDDEVEQDEGTKFVFVSCCGFLWFDFNSIFSKDYFDEGNPPMSPRDTLKEASDVLSILSGHGGGIKVISL